MQERKRGSQNYDRRPVHVMSSTERQRKFQDSQRKKELLAIERREKRNTFKRSGAEWFVIDSEIFQREPMSVAAFAELQKSNPEMAQCQMDYELCDRFNISYLPPETRTDRIIESCIEDDAEKYVFFETVQDVLKAIERGRWKMSAGYSYLVLENCRVRRQKRYFG